MTLTKTIVVAQHFYQNLTQTNLIEGGHTYVERYADRKMILRCIKCMEESLANFVIRIIQWSGKKSFSCFTYTHKKKRRTLFGEHEKDKPMTDIIDIC